MFSSRNCLIVLLVLLAVAGTDVFLRLKPSFSPPPPAPADAAALSVLGEAPDWEKLESYQNTITRADFERLLTTVFTIGPAWHEFIEIDDHEARIRTGSAMNAGIYRLHFAPPGTVVRAKHDWKAAAELPPAPAGKPLDGLRIAIDPGHIGGQWAKIEERWFMSGEGKAVCEGDMTLAVANLLKPRLEALGATVLLVRSKCEPVTTQRPESLFSAARYSQDPAGSPAGLQKVAERLFYRTAEIRARAKLVNLTLKPDLVLCLHFNAEDWGNPNQPTPTKHSHLHLLVNGAYSGSEIALADQRFDLLEKLLGGCHDEEAHAAATIAETFAQASGLPPFSYPTDSTKALPVNGNPYLWARNLLANRLYRCPVIYTEPYVMNSDSDLPRIQAGDYEGLREINGKSRPSIFREYADAVAAGLATYYLQNRKADR